MTLPPRYVRVSLFQAKSKSKESVLFRSSVEDYRGDVLIPLDALDGWGSSTGKEKAVGVAQLIKGLEQRLSRYCVLHVPPARTKAFVEENHLQESSLTQCSADGTDNKDSGVSAEKSSSAMYCTECSPLLAREAAASTASIAALPKSEQAPWIHVCQLHRMPGGLAGGSADVLTAEDWMLRQQGPSEHFVSDEEAAALQIQAVDEESAVCGGECFAAFFQLQMIPRNERDVRLMESSLIARTQDIASMAQQQQQQHSSPHAFFTVQALRNTVRIGLPPLSSLSGDSRELGHSQDAPLPSLRSVVLHRLQAQRGVTVRRFVDTQTEAAVLPCEPASVLLAASLTHLTAECVELVEDQLRHSHAEGSTQQLPPSLLPPSSLPPQVQTQKLSTSVKAGTEATGDFFDRLIGMRAQRRGDQYYYDGFNAHDWADKRTAISLSDLPSESELRMTSVASQGSHFTAIFPHSSPTSASPRHPSQASRTTASLFNASAENSRSNPFALVYREGEETSNSAVALEHAEAEHSEPGLSLMEPERAPNARQSSSANNTDIFALSSGHATAPSTPSLVAGHVTPNHLHDSLLGMNEVFVYEDEETVTVPQLQDGEDNADDDHESFSARQRRSSLVWSTPAARGSAGGFNFADSGVSATPLTYRTSTQLSSSPVESPAAALAADRKPRAMGTQPVHRLDFSPSGSSSCESVPSCGIEEEEAEAHDRKKSNTSASDTAVITGNEVSPGEASFALERNTSEEAQSFNGVLSTAHRSATQPSLSSSSSLSPSSFASSSTSTRHKTSEDQQTADASYRVVTPPRQHAASLSTSSRHFACTPPSYSASSPSPSVRAAQGELQPLSHLIQDEETSPLPSCATPPSRSRASERELRSHLQDKNSLPTQSSDAQRHEKEGVSRAASFSSPACSAKRPRAEESPVHYGSSQRVARLDGSFAARSALHDIPRSPPSFAYTPQRSPGALAAAARASHTLTADSSLPSTVAANRARRHRSPIFFSPGEVARMTDDPPCRDDRCYSDGTVEARDNDGSTHHSSPPDQHYGPFIASYPLHEGVFDDVDDDVARWGYGSSASLQHSSSRPSQLQQQQQRGPSQSSTPQRALVSSGAQLFDAGTSRPFPFISGVPGPLSERRRQQQQPWTMSSEGGESGGLALGNCPRVTSQRLRRSESHSASGMETWVRFSDIEGEDASNLRGVGEEWRADDGDELMLVTQQEIPEYAAQLGSSESQTDAEEDEEEGNESHGSTESE